MLPKIDSPVYSVKLPISGLTTRYRPYTVKEQKLLAMAKEANDKNSIIDAILQICQNCVLDKIDVPELPLNDVEYLFYMLRARSESEIVELRYKCENIINEEGDSCNNIMDCEFNLLNDLEVIKSDVSDIIKVTDSVGLKLKYEKLEHDTVGNRLITPEETLEIIAKNVDYIYDENSAYSSKDVPMKEIIEWVGNLPPEKYTDIEEFFNNQPAIIKKLNITCKKCGFEHTIVVKDIFSFFI